MFDSSERGGGRSPSTPPKGGFWWRLWRRIDEEGDTYLLLWLYSFIVLVIFIEVVRRFVLDFSSLWGEETARYAFIYLVWIGAARAVRDRSHIRIDVLSQFLPTRGRDLLAIIGGILTIVFACLGLYYSLGPLETSLRFGSVTDGLRITKAWFLISVPFGFTLIVLRSIEMLVRDVVALVRGEELMGTGKLFD